MSFFHKIGSEFIKDFFTLLETTHTLVTKSCNNITLNFSNFFGLLFFKHLFLSLIFLSAYIWMPKWLPLKLVILLFVLQFSLSHYEYLFKVFGILRLFWRFIQDVLKDLDYINTNLLNIYIFNGTTYVISLFLVSNGLWRSLICLLLYVWFLLNDR
jgi:hypothetical protein